MDGSYAFASQTSHNRPQESRPVDAVVLGAGVVGMATAYTLLQHGLTVCLVDRASAPARGASYANGAQLSYAYSDALASPALIRKMPALALGLDPLFRLRPGFDPGLYGWLLSFLRNASHTRFEKNTLDVLQLALESQLAMTELLARHSIAFDYSKPGKMHLHYSDTSLAQAAVTADLKRGLGVDQHILTRLEAMRLEPALAQVEGLAGVVYSPDDAVGDPRAFSEELLALCRLDERFTTQFNCTINRIESLAPRDIGFMAGKAVRSAASA